MSGAPIPSLKLNLDIKRQVLCSKLKIEQQIWIRIINCSTYTFARPSGVASGPSASSSVLWFGHFTNCRFFRRTLNRKRDHGAEKERCRRTDGRRTDGRAARGREKTTANAESLRLHFPSIGAFDAAPLDGSPTGSGRTTYCRCVINNKWVGWLGGGNRDVEMMNE